MAQVTKVPGTKSWVKIRVEGEGERERGGGGRGRRRRRKRNGRKRSGRRKRKRRGGGGEGKMKEREREGERKKEKERERGKEGKEGHKGGRKGGRKDVHWTWCAEVKWKGRIQGKLHAVEHSCWARKRIQPLSPCRTPDIIIWWTLRLSFTANVFPRVSWVLI